LSACPLFAHLDVFELLQCARVTEESFCRGDAVRSTDNAPALGILLDGKVRVGKSAAHINALMPGDPFGLVALFTEGGAPTTVTAQTACRALFVPQKTVLALMRTHPRFSADVAAYLSGRIRFLTGRLAALGGGGAEEKLLTYLRQHALGDRLVAPNMTTIAARLGLGRTTLYRALTSLAESGQLQRVGKDIVLADTFVE
jgi:CRP-like cAMP-binding protein